ncbi:MAG: SIS domain-containing protein [Clostridia bacterium]|nr:SIS domain-containing protein [Clostridia bacterium]
MELYELTSAHPGLLYCLDTIPAAQDLLVNTYRRGGKLLLCGNGGSCADCDHITGELLKGFLSLREMETKDRLRIINALPEEDPDVSLLCNKLQGGLPAISLPAQTALISAFSNDVDGSLVYAQLVWALGQEGDTLVCLSTSGNSRNVVLAAKAARAKGMKVLALTGERDSKLSELADVTVKAPSTETFRVQEYHLPIYHYLCAKIEEEFFY